MIKRPPDQPLFAGHPLTRKLAIVTVIKLLGLMALWWTFFSGEDAHKGAHMTPDQAAAAILHPNLGNTTKQ
jgi:hypothetical protein